MHTGVETTARLLRKLVYLDDADDLRDLFAPPGNKLETLHGDREGQYSIRINDQLLHQAAKEPGRSTKSLQRMAYSHR